MYQLVYMDLQKCIFDQMWESVMDALANWNSNMKTLHNQQMPEDAGQRHAWLIVTFLCKSLAFGFVNADSFCYNNNIYNPQIKFISKYLRPMVIHCKRHYWIPLILWGDMCNLSQILHIPGNDSNSLEKRDCRYLCNIPCYSKYGQYFQKWNQWNLIQMSCIIHHQDPFFM